MALENIPSRPRAALRFIALSIIPEPDVMTDITLSLEGRSRDWRGGVLHTLRRLLILLSLLESQHPLERLQTFFHGEHIFDEGLSIELVSECHRVPRSCQQHGHSQTL